MSEDPIMEPLTITLETDNSVPSSFPVVLKKIMEIPPPNLLEGDDENDKEKLCLGDNVDLGGDVSGIGPTAALTPAIWDKTIPYDAETFHLEYMDLEEFLMENGISTSLEGTTDKEGSEDKKSVKKAAALGTGKPKVTSPPGEPVSLMPILELEPCEEEVVTLTLNNADISTSADSDGETSDNDEESPEPFDPEEIEVEVNFEPDPTDLVLSSVPGGELFNPRKHKFSDEELKPQPMIKKAKKVFVPEEQKDEKYWQRRKKNNVAAKRSRDARRLKENQITVRAAFLERENTALRQEVAELRKDFGRCKNVLTRYEDKFGTLAPVEED